MRNPVRLGDRVRYRGTSHYGEFRDGTRSLIRHRSEGVVVGWRTTGDVLVEVETTTGPVRFTTDPFHLEVIREVG